MLPAITLNEREQHAYTYLFRLCDTDNDGLVSGRDAVRALCGFQKSFLSFLQVGFFQKSKLPTPVLKEVCYYTLPVDIFL